MLVIRNAVAEAVKGTFAGKERAKLIEALLFRALQATDLQGSGPGLLLSLEDALSIDPDAERVNIAVDPTGTIKVTPAGTETRARAERSAA